MEEFTVYVIINENNDIYIGQTNNFEVRLKHHNGELSTKIKSYTHKHKNGKWKVAYQEILSTRKEALKREKQLKSYQGRQFIEQTINSQQQTDGLLS